MTPRPVGQARARPLPGAATYLPDPLWKELGAVHAGHTVTVDDDPWYLNAGPTAIRAVLRYITGRLGR
ncbi:hypothetical protein ABZ817_22130 [Streptomyces antimycoticus]|uniref:hypothetical protein n=1 Tax=Streptomyces antimycoticus TaxID=68175 RepID=UPI0033D7DDF9